MLNCIVDMVEKTRRSVSVLRRCQEADREELNYWRRRSNEQEDPRKGGSGSAPFSKTHSPHSAESGTSLLDRGVLLLSKKLLFSLSMIIEIS